MYNVHIYCSIYCCSCPRAYLPLCLLPIRAWWRCAMPKIHHLAFPFPSTGSTHVVRYQEHHRWRCTWFMQRGDLPLSQKLGKKQLGAHLQHGRQSIEEMGGLGWGDGRGEATLCRPPIRPIFPDGQEGASLIYCFAIYGYKLQCIF